MGENTDVASLVLFRGCVSLFSHFSGVDSSHQVPLLPGVE